MLWLVISIGCGVFFMGLIPILFECFEMLPLEQTCAVAATTAVVLAMTVLLVSITVPNEIDEHHFESKNEEDLDILMSEKDSFLSRIFRLRH